MKKELFAALTLILLLTLSFINIHFLDKLTEDISTLVTDAGEAAKSGDWETARELAESAFQKWEASCSYTHLVLRHTEIEAAGDTLTDLLSEVYTKSSGGVEGAVVAAVSRMKCIASIEHVRPGSVF